MEKKMEESQLRQQISALANLSESLRIVSNGLSLLAKEIEFIHVTIEKIIKDDLHVGMDDQN
jgi:seryl-tRNA synthetase